MPTKQFSSMDDKNSDDPYLWLEEIEGREALDWVGKQNQLTLGEFRERPLFVEMEKRSREILDSQEKLAYPQFVGDMVYNFWRDQDYEHGLLRRMPLPEYIAGSGEWEEVLDLDRLCEEEGENWVYKGHQLFSPENERTLLWLSRGGSDACVVREYDLSRRRFVPDGFVVPEAKSDIAWKDRDTLYVGTRFDDDSMTDSGYPRVLKVWKRGTPLEQAEFLFEVQKSDLAASAWVSRRPEATHQILHRTIDFWNDEATYLKDGEKFLLPLPTDAPIKGIYHDRLLLVPRTDWQAEDSLYAAGSLLAVDLPALLRGESKVELVVNPGAGGTIEAVSALESSVVVAITQEVQSSLYRYRFTDGAWVGNPIPTPRGGEASFVATSSWRDDLFLSHEDFLTPTTLFHLSATGELRDVQSLPRRFQSDDLVSEQLWVESADGTKVPYYIIYRNHLPQGADTPAILYGYGGFEVSLLPRYMSLTGANWLERGGLFISANIRGGGEFGPTWHQAALRENRHKAYEDFEAVAKDVVARGFTKPERLAVHGGSNGGLLTGNMLTRSPELFGAIVIGVPLLDMKRYHKLLAGASWMAEYGDPDDEADWRFLKTYSPYHNVERGRRYPPVLLYTSTKDDRVHPGHARKMVAKLQEYGYRVDYYENTEGGHAGASNNKQQAFLSALIHSYLWQKLG